LIIHFGKTHEVIKGCMNTIGKLNEAYMRAFCEPYEILLRSLEERSLADVTNQK